MDNKILEMIYIQQTSECGALEYCTKCFNEDISQVEKEIMRLLNKKGFRASYEIRFAG